MYNLDELLTKTDLKKFCTNLSKELNNAVVNRVQMADRETIELYKKSQDVLCSIEWEIGINKTDFSKVFSADKVYTFDIYDRMRFIELYNEITENNSDDEAEDLYNHHLRKYKQKQQDYKEDELSLLRRILGKLDDIDLGKKKRKKLKADNIKW